MHDPIRLANEPTSVGRSRQSIFKFVYRTKLVNECRLITVKWCKNLLLDKTRLAEAMVFLEKTGLQIFHH
ncbi:DUF868 domain-containing protein [Gossypium australe]|uniref:DUF868 domain-containing protein n=1 Tax=Gossypium australe TaxID=47621 RepID=A0A5B6WMC5_9ROSI|nr:DUF868 domain-containing protein [Gossypium australe]